MSVFLEDAFALRDVLAEFRSGTPPEFSKRAEMSLLLSARLRAKQYPNHYYTAMHRRLFGDVKSWGGLVLASLAAVGENYFENRRHFPISIKATKFGDWQRLIAAMPPVFPIAAMLQRHYGGLGAETSPKKIENFFQAFVSLQVGRSALPAVDDPFLDGLIAERGLTELHMHLNGSSEAGAIWHEALVSPKEFCDEFFAKAKGQQATIQALRQEDSALNLPELAERLRLAAIVRRYLAVRIFQTWPSMPVALVFEEPPAFRSFLENADRREERSYLWPYQADRHPAEIALGPLAKDAAPAALETFFVSALLAAIEREPNSDLGDAVYLYLLLQAQFWRLLVQQRDQYGFEQFNAIATNGLRDHSEKRYSQRFRELHYSSSGDLMHLEGRIAPKEDPSKLTDLLASIFLGYCDYLLPNGKRPQTLSGLLERLNAPKRVMRDRHFDLQLVVHFIKEPDRTPTKPLSIIACRHYKLRRKHESQWVQLRRALQRHSQLRNFIVGFDGAGSEIDAPPEVFAPLFRRIAWDSHRNFTFHVGEDFRHLLSGIRAVSEALTFLNLRSGNRIGHATAIGIDPELWLSRSPQTIALPRGQHLDDLVFAWRYLAQGGRSTAAVALSEPISRLSNKIYGRTISPELLIEAWMLRDLDPVLAFGDVSGGRQFRALGTAEEVEFTRIETAQRNEAAWRIFEQYHGNGGEAAARHRHDEMIEIDRAVAGLQIADIRYLQECVLDDVAGRGIAIEAMPTSNVRISCYEDYREHHLFRWLDRGATENTGRPIEVCVGSDDPGIFATNLRNEFAHLYLTLQSVRPATAKQDIERLQRCARDYAFRPAGRL